MPCGRPPASAIRSSRRRRRRPGYQTHYAVDGGRARIILHALTTPGDVMEGQTLPDLLRRVRFRWRVRPERAVGDSKYGTVANIVALEDAGIRAYVALADTEHRDSPYYPLAAFRYDAAGDTYWCPQGQPLRRYRVAWEKELVGYVADPGACNACSVKTACTPGKSGRHLHRSLHAAYLDRVRGYHATESYKRAMRKRGMCGFGTSAPAPVHGHRDPSRPAAPGALRPRRGRAGCAGPGRAPPGS